MHIERKYRIPIPGFGVFNNYKIKTVSEIKDKSEEDEASEQWKKITKADKRPELDMVIDKWRITEFWWKNRLCEISTDVHV